MVELSSAKQPYEPPLLIVEGDVADLTAGGATPVIDTLGVGSQ